MRSIHIKGNRERGDRGGWTTQQDRRRHHRRGAAALCADAGPAAQRDHAEPDRAPAHLRQGGELDRGRVVPGDRDPDRSRADVQRQAPGIHPVLGHFGRVDGGRSAEPPQTRRSDRIDRVRAVPSARARPKCRGAATSPISTKRVPRPWSAAGCSTSTAGRSPARCSTYGRHRPAASTTSQDPNLHELHMRGKFRTDAEGRYLVRTVLPVNYPIPSDGPVGAMLRATGRHPWRPAHIHFVVLGRGLRAGDDAHLRPHRRISRQRCGVRGQGVADLRLHPARERRRRRPAGSASTGPITPRISTSA